jgi:acyl carrier protein
VIDKNSRDDMETLSFDQFVSFIRTWGSVSKKKQISPETQFERDLGITGDDGSDLLIATEKQFCIRLSSEESGYRETFGLEPNEYLFNSEGFGMGAGLSDLITIFNTPTVRAFTVGELFSAVQRAMEGKHQVTG